MNCIFCDFKNDKEKVVLENDLAYAIFDGFPINKGHMLIIPKRHAETYFDLTEDEIKAMNELVFKAKKLIDDKYKPDGYNIGLNCGEYAGQTVFHCHMHIIPRYKGDTPNPRGVVRNIIKGQSKY